MSTTNRYTILVSNEKEGGYSGKCLELPAAISQGDTLEELENNMREAIQLVLEHLKSKGKKGKYSKEIIVEVAV